jgi:hypothetical protein
MLMRGRCVGLMVMVPEELFVSVRVSCVVLVGRGKTNPRGRDNRTAPPSFIVNRELYVSYGTRHISTMFTTKHMMSSQR